MWVYQEQQNLPALSAGADAPEPVEPGLVPECSAPVAETPPAEPIIEEAEAKEKIPKRTLPHASRDCILLAGAYLFGTFLAGRCPLCAAPESWKRWGITSTVGALPLRRIPPPRSSACSAPNS